jgi:DNA mismatch endonuclease (patch repair protein)
LLAELDSRVMSDVYSKEIRSRVMSRIRKRNTKPEIAVRRVLHMLGYRFRLHRQDLPGVPDIVLPRHRAVVLVHGCFWHQHTCPLGKVPKSNLAYWRPKLRRNQRRNAQTAKALERLGWKVVVIWECESTSLDRLERILRAGLGRKKPLRPCRDRS